jgi:aromatase
MSAPTGPPQQTTVHSRIVAARPESVYDLVADVSRWPVIFGPTVHVRHLARTPQDERFQLWALVGGAVKTWTSRRTLDRRALRIGFRQERSQPPIAAMAGEWEFRPRSGGRTEVVLTHRFATTGDGDALTAAVHHNSEQELAALGRIAELPHPVDDVVFTFSDTLRLPGAAFDAYTFVYRAEAWPDRLPHVRRVLLREDQAGVQHMEMDTVTADGSAHTTRSVRLCFPHERIVYTQLVPPDLLFGHSGAWTFRTDPDGVTVTARHTVGIDPGAVPRVLGAGSTLADARAYLREALGANSRATVLHAGTYARARAAAAPHGAAT